MTAMLRNLAITRCNWKAPIALPPRLAERRAAFLARATGPQLKRLCQKPQLSDRDAALLDVWRRLAPRYAVARRVITDCGVAPANALVVGAGAATVAALPSFTTVYGGRGHAGARGRCSTTARRPQGSSIIPNLAAVATREPSPEQAFDFVIATDHFVNCDDPETHLAVLWGCVAENGLLAVIERESSPIREARSRLMSEGTPLEPSTSELLPQCFAEPVEGPPPRSTRKADAGTALKRRAQRVEKFASCVFRRGGSDEMDGRRRRAIVTSTPLKRAGHVVVDARDDSGAERRLTLSRARLREVGTPFKDARRLTVGSVLAWDDDVIFVVVDRSSLPPRRRRHSHSHAADAAYLERPPRKDGRAVLVVLAPQDPHRLERGQRGEIDPPIQHDRARSGGARTRIVVSGSFDRRSFTNRSPKPGNSVEPPAKTTDSYKVARRSKSARRQASATNSAAPGSSEPMTEGSNSASDARNLSPSSLTWDPSGKRKERGCASAKFCW